MSADYPNVRILYNGNFVSGEGYASENLICFYLKCILVGKCKLKDVALVEGTASAAGQPCGQWVRAQYWFCTGP